jgi:hypothetical protein
VTNAAFTFDETNGAHTYRLSGRRVPSVTQVIREVMGGGWMASDWHRDRGSANHACYALMAAGHKPGVDFDVPEVSVGFVAAWQEWVTAHKVRFIAWEQMVVSQTYQYAGMLDLVGEVDNQLCVVDYKGTLDERVKWQLAAYAMAYSGMIIKTGLGVELHEDGSLAKMTWFDLKLPTQEWQAMRTVYGMKQKLGTIKENEA